jgi:predicted lipoprotein with Yx(FWY)xxD motif
MRRSGWAVAAVFGSLVLSLTACGGSSSSSSSSSSPAASNPATSPAAAGQPSGAASLPAKGTTVLIVEHSKLGWVLAMAKDGLVVYTYSGDTKGGMPTCTGPCAAVWPAVTGIPMVSSADTLPGTLGTVTMPNGAKQITYNGYPLYLFKGAGPFSTKGQGLEGKWHVIKLAASDITFSG